MVAGRPLGLRRDCLWNYRDPCSPCVNTLGVYPDIHFLLGLIAFAPLYNRASLYLSLITRTPWDTLFSHISHHISGSLISFLSHPRFPIQTGWAVLDLQLLPDNPNLSFDTLQSFILLHPSNYS